MTNPTVPSPRLKRAQRRDGRSTRAVVLDAAGKVFAERGFGEATSKEICERAGTNNAAVNYYFGGKEGLYEEVLVEAHRQMLSLEDLNDIVASDASPEDKLRVFLGHIIRTAMNAPELWGIRIFLRELASPSPFVPRFIRTTALPQVPQAPGTGVRRHRPPAGFRNGAAGHGLRGHALHGVHPLSGKTAYRHPPRQRLRRGGAA